MYLFLSVIILITAPVILVIIWRHRLVLLACFCEPILSRPVVIIESDDWSPADYDHKGLLCEVLDLVRRFKDREGRTPKFTLGLVLRAPFRKSANNNQCMSYALFSDSIASDIRELIAELASDGAVDLQLHCNDHFWPQTFESKYFGSKVLEELETGNGFVDVLFSYTNNRGALISSLNSSMT